MRSLILFAVVAALGVCVPRRADAQGDPDAPVLGASTTWVHPDGTSHVYEYYRHPDAAAVYLAANGGSEEPYRRFYTWKEASDFVAALPSRHGVRPLLASITSAEEQAMIESLTAQPSLSYGLGFDGPLAAWFGGFRTGDGQPWQWVTSEAWIYERWASESMAADHTRTLLNTSRTWNARPYDEPVRGTYPAFIVEYPGDACGMPVAWMKQFGSSGPFDSANATAVFADGRIVVAGTFGGTGAFDGFSGTRTAGGPADVFVASFAPDGSPQWLRTFGGGDEDIATGATAFPDGSVVVTGFFASTVTFGEGEPSEVTFTDAGWSDTFILRLRADGSMAWAKRVTGPSQTNPRAVAALPDGSFYLEGYHIYTGATLGIGEPNETVHGGIGSYVARYNSDGTLAWARLVGGDSESNALGLCAMSDGGCVVTGYFFGASRFETSAGVYSTLSATGSMDVFVVRYDSSGQMTWLKRAGGSGTDQGLGAAAFSDDSVVVTGTFTGSALFGPGEGSATTLVSSGGQEIFVARYLQDGTLAWAKSAGGSENQEAGLWAHVLPDDTCLITGHAGGTAPITFGRDEPSETSLPGRGVVDTFIAQYSMSGAFLCAHPVAGPDADVAYSVAFVPPRGIVLAGFFASTATFGENQLGQPAQLTARGGRDGFLVRYLFEALPEPNVAPVADAGPCVTILTQEQAGTTILGSAADADGDALTYEWLLGETTVLGPSPVVDGACPLPLGGLDALPVGDYMLTLRVSDGRVVSADEMCLTIENSPPVAGPTGGGVYEIGSGVLVTLAGSVADFDGDVLTLTWQMDGSRLFPDDVVTPDYGGDPVGVPTHTLSTLDLGLGVHEICLVVDDGVNEDVVACVRVEVVDGTAPSLNPVPSLTILWPPNHRMVDVSVAANAADNSGGAISLSVDVTSSEPPDACGDGNFEPDYEIVSVDSATGLIRLRLRAERSGRGDGRVYTIRITATDSSGNFSTATVEIRAPKDRRHR